MPLPFRILILAGAALLTALIIRALPMADLFAAFAEVARNPWGLVGLVDLYLGFILFAGVIVGFEVRRGIAIGWVVGLFLLGNVVGAIWMVWRHRQLWKALKAAHAS